jgi:hypothetical protein
MALHRFPVMSAKVGPLRGSGRSFSDAVTVSAISCKHTEVAADAFHLPTQPHYLDCLAVGL